MRSCKNYSRSAFQLRLLVKLSSEKKGRLPINYNYPLASTIYKLLRFSSPEFAYFLHDIGYRQENKTYKLFTFALRFEKFIIDKDAIILKSPNAVLYISSPLVDSFIQNFVMGTLEKQQIEINDGKSFTSFYILQVESITEPLFTGKMKFKLLSPLVLSTKMEMNGRLTQYYLRPDDVKKINEVLTNNLINKYKLIHKKEIEDKIISLNWDKGYLKKHNRITKKITINENGIYPIDVIGIQAPFTLIGDPDLIKTGYECGFGEKNSMGFGCAEAY